MLECTALCFAPGFSFSLTKLDAKQDKCLGSHSFSNLNVAQKKSSIWIQRVLPKRKKSRKTSSFVYLNVPMSDKTFLRFIAEIFCDVGHFSPPEVC